MLYAPCRLLLALCALPLGAVEWLPADTAPAIRAELLVHATVGGPGDQRFIGVRTTRKGADATDGSGLLVHIAIDEAAAAGEDGIEVQVRGNKNVPSTKQAPSLLGNGGSVLGISYGFKQVHSILQQPYATGRGWKLWGWDHAAASGQNLMADTRMRGGVAMPNGHALLIGWCDGGNTSLHRDPRDITQGSPHIRYKHGGGSGVSNLLTEVVPATGEVRAQAFLGTAIGAVCWDPWGRMYAVGTNLCKGGHAPFDTGGSGSLLVLSPDWSQALIDARLGSPGGSYKDNMWESVALDHERGILVLGGWTGGALGAPMRGVQDGHGGDKDAMIAVIRLWTPGDYDAAKAR